MALMQSALTFLSSWKFIVLFYVILAIVVFINRKKFQVEGGFILLYKTKWGMSLIDKVAEKYKEFIKIIGYSAIGVGFVGMIVICGFFIKGLYNLVFIPNAPPTVSLVIPGVQIPGSPIFVPFWYGIIALFFVVSFHEFGHGIVAKANGIRIKSTGVGLFGPIPLAFVEPDESQVVKKSSVIKQSIFAAGPFFNGLLAIVIMLLILIVNSALFSMTTPSGIMFGDTMKGFPAQQYGLKTGVVYTSMNGKPITDSDNVVTQLSHMLPNQTITFGNNETNISIVTTSSPDNHDVAYLGVNGISNSYKLKSDSGISKFIFGLLTLLSNPFATSFSEWALLQWIFTLSLGIGLANLLPLGPVDGGRMLYTAATDVAGKKGVKIWSAITIAVIVILIILVFVPIIKNLFFKI